MSEIDGRLRNERITHETDLDLLKEETVLELESEMEERLAEFRSRKEEEVATQLERQLDKREEIMRNKALIEVRKREANIRAEIEAQLGVKRAEIRDRLSSLTKQMDDFKAMAEVKMRESIEGKVQSEIEADESRLAEQQSEFEELKSQDNRVEKRQSWLQAISGQGTQAEAPSMGMDPSALGAKPNLLGSSAGRPMRGAMAQAAAQHTPSMGLAGMRAPRSTARSLSGAQPMARPVKAPIGGMNLPAQGAILPQPIQPKVVRQPVKQPIETPVVSSPQIVPPTIEPEVDNIVSAPQIPAPVLEPKIEDIVAEEQLEIEAAVEEEIPTVVPETDSMDDVLEEALDEAMEDELEPVQETTMLVPIKKLEVASEQKAAILKPVTVEVLTPAKRRGPPPSSKPGMKPGSEKPVEETVLRPITKLNPVEETVLRPITKLNPVSAPDVSLNIDSDKDDS